MVVLDSHSPTSSACVSSRTSPGSCVGSMPCAESSAGRRVSSGKAATSIPCKKNALRAFTAIDPGGVEQGRETLEGQQIPKNHRTPYKHVGRDGLRRQVQWPTFTPASVLVQATRRNHDTSFPHAYSCGYVLPPRVYEIRNVKTHGSSHFIQLSVKVFIEGRTLRICLIRNAAVCVGRDS